MNRSNEFSYVYEKLFSAVSILAAGAGSVQSRVEHAYYSAFLRLQPSDFSVADLRKTFEAVKNGMTNAPSDGDRGTVAVAASRMSDETATKVAEAILSLFARIAELDALAQNRRKRANFRARVGRKAAR